MSSCKVQLVTLGDDILEGSPPGQVAAARSVLTGKGIALIANAAVSHLSDIAQQYSHLGSETWWLIRCGHTRPPS